MVESAASDTLVGGRVVLVQPGDTLWSIARGLQPTGDVRPLIDRIAELNGGHSLIAGQTLMLP
jgi:Tfp pilus assembly protein FimV